MKKVKIDFSWKVWSLIIGFFVFVGTIGISYAYGSSNPSVMGHSGDEIVFTNGYGDTMTLGGDDSGNDFQISINAPEERNTLSVWNTRLGKMADVQTASSSSEKSFGEYKKNLFQEDVVYTAEEDGFLIGVLVRGGDDTGSYSLVYAGDDLNKVSNYDASVLRGSASTYAYYYFIYSSSFNVPIKKGEYFKIHYSQVGAAATRYYSWMPLN